MRLPRFLTPLLYPPRRLQTLGNRNGDTLGRAQLFGLSAGFLTFARLVVPLRIALALALTPAMDKYVVKGFLKKGDETEEMATEEAEVDAAEV